MRSKDLAKAAGLAVAFDHTAPTFYRMSLFLSKLALKNFFRVNCYIVPFVFIEVTSSGKNHG